MSAPGIFGNEQLEQLARAAAERCREEICTHRVPYGPMLPAEAARVDALQQLMIDDARWALGAMRAGVYATIDTCVEFKRFAADFVQKHPALSLQAPSGIILAAR